MISRHTLLYPIVQQHLIFGVVITARLDSKKLQCLGRLALGPNTNFRLRRAPVVFGLKRAFFVRTSKLPQAQRLKQHDRCDRGDGGYGVADFHRA